MVSISIIKYNINGERTQESMCCKDFLQSPHLCIASIDRTMSGDDAWIEYKQLPTPTKRTNQQCK